MAVHSVRQHVSTAGVLGNIAGSYDARAGIDLSYHVEEVPAPGPVRKRTDRHNGYFFDVSTIEPDCFPFVTGARTLYPYLWNMSRARSLTERSLSTMRINSVPASNPCAHYPRFLRSDEVPVARN
jgi:hypothetical protein